MVANKAGLYIVDPDRKGAASSKPKDKKDNESQKARIRVNFNQNLTEKQLYVHGAQDRDWFLDMFQSLFKGSPTNGYQRRLGRHREYFG